MKYYLSLFCLLYSLTLSSQASFYATVDAKEILSDSYVTVSFTVKNASASSFRAPKFSNFTVIQGPAQSNSTSIRNGRKTTEISYTYVLKPNKKGNIKIGSASISINGKTQKTKPIIIKVLNAPKKVDKKKRFFVEAVVSDTTAMLGQQILVDYIFYYGINENINSIRLQNEDEFEGFYTAPINDYQNNPERVIIGGNEYVKQTVRKIALFPQTAGKFDLQPTTFVIFIPKSGQRSFFFNSFKEEYVTTQVKSIQVNPLPSRDPFFNGAVGSYFLSAQSNKNTISTDQSISLLLTVFGDGDPKLINAPVLSLSDSLEVYDPNFIREENYVDQGRQKHKTIYEYLILPQHVGNYSIRPSMTYFNTDSNSYQRAYSNTLNINVIQGAGKIVGDDVKLSKRADKMIAFKNQISVSKGSFSFFGSFPFWSILGIVLLSFPFLGFMKYQKNLKDGIDPELLKSQNARKVAIAKLASAKDFMDQNNQRSFYDEISKSILGYASDKIKIPVSELGKKNILEKLEQLEVSANNIQTIKEILTSCEMALFAASNESDKMQKTYDNTISAISAIETELT